MEVTDANLQSLAGYLEQTLSPDAAVRRAGKPTNTDCQTLSCILERQT